MTATDRARFFAGEYPRRPRMRIRNRCHTSDRIAIIRTTYPLEPWLVTSGGEVLARTFHYEDANRVAFAVADQRRRRLAQQLIQRFWS